MSRKSGCCRLWFLSNTRYNVLWTRVRGHSTNTHLLATPLSFGVEHRACSVSRHVFSDRPGHLIHIRLYDRRGSVVFEVFYCSVLEQVPRSTSVSHDFRWIITNHLLLSTRGRLTCSTVGLEPNSDPGPRGWVTPIKISKSDFNWKEQKQHLPKTLKNKDVQIYTELQSWSH